MPKISPWPVVMGKILLDRQIKLSLLSIAENELGQPKSIKFSSSNDFPSASCPLPPALCYCDQK
jgi:hypothetical protein